MSLALLASTSTEPSFVLCSVRGGGLLLLETHAKEAAGGSVEFSINTVELLTVSAEHLDSSVVSAGALRSIRELHVAAATEDKRVHYWVYDAASGLTKRGSRKFSKRLSYLEFSGDARFLIVADKVGDIHRVALATISGESNEEEESEAPWMGHFGLVTCISLGVGRVASGDREGKIRVSRYPDSFVIDSFCLGHKTAVSCVSFVDDSACLLLSGDASGHVCLWDASNGDLLDEKILDDDSPQPIVGITPFISESRSGVAVLKHQSSDVYIFHEVIRSRAIREESRIGLDVPLSGMVTGYPDFLWASSLQANEGQDSAVIISLVSDAAHSQTLQMAISQALRSSLSNLDPSGPLILPGEWISALSKKQYQANWKKKKRRVVGDDEKSSPVKTEQV
uniref:WD repeat-containing protein 4 homolog n=1 Tax=Compsopogon caeruleus TaxID=31354 RepID=A0A7S1THT1_9RHOD|mmetsp:Transcript_8266/g.16751  ORF Transcript_8266/g.16751 Transcript_8266/m.16751 type:complete len:395 (+) Transcript_8266:965-2149(+)|eukprot:CAMPEP_0184690602 /NCGR_PEP_ID=MMETSP0312-20130426/31322_1 /TAXON_ID=31354 /ORGANISM="Compsopogon coeruleus, Strain SAG 36.94" /LENGTH=394 /DNA_ID=CAMNT_0027148121 /DNA_START=913 /DNA_END=2097 /DNA_ORIENTATION=+